MVLKKTSNGILGMGKVQLQGGCRKPAVARTKGGGGMPQNDIINQGNLAHKIRQTINAGILHLFSPLRVPSLLAPIQRYRQFFITCMLGEILFNPQETSHEGHWSIHAFPFKCWKKPVCGRLPALGQMDTLRWHLITFNPNPITNVSPENPPT